MNHKRKFYAAFVLSFCSLVAGFSACSTLKENSVAAQLVVTYAAQKYVEDAPSAEWPKRAERVKTVALSVLAVAEADAVTIDELVQLALTKIPADSPPSDRALAVVLVRVAADELKKKIGETNPDFRVELAKVIQWIADACAFYPAPSASITHPVKAFRV